MGIFSRDKTVKKILVAINSVATTAVALVKKLPADLDETKLSWDAPIPRAPPSDFCKIITIGS